MEREREREREREENVGGGVHPWVSFYRQSGPSMVQNRLHSLNMFSTIILFIIFFYSSSPTH